MFMGFKAISHGAAIKIEYHVRALIEPAQGIYGTFAMCGPISTKLAASCAIYIKIRFDSK